MSKAGITVVSWSLDHPAPMGKTVRDLAVLLGVMSGVDPKDPSSKNLPVPDYAKALDGDVRGIRVGVPGNYFFEDVQPAVAHAVGNAVNVLEKLGAAIVPMTAPSMEAVIDSWLAIALAEAATYHQQSLRSKGDLYADDVRFLA
ncbi:Asp-tRNA(Asn)/Glu-tRNA(Gln) amidotransferase A subunit family amidase [Bradyrhizobium sp. LB7.2]